MRPIAQKMLFVVLSLAMLLFGPGCRLGDRDEARAEDTGQTRREPRSGAAEVPQPSPVGLAPARGARAGAGEVSYFQDASSIPGKLKGKINGPVRLLELGVYPTYAFAQIQDPAKRDNVDEYKLREGQVGDGVPVKFVGQIPNAADLEAITFDLSTVDMAAVPKMAAEAVTSLGIDDGKVSHMLLKRGIPFNKDVRWRVYVNGTRRDGSVEFDPSGRVLKVWK